MNKIYKVIWNFERGILIVTDENRCAKGKKSSTSLLFVPALLLVLPLSAGAAVVPLNGWSATTVAVAGNRHDITTTASSGPVAINKFQSFGLDKGKLANLIFPANTAHLLNFVNEGVDIKGTVNAVKNSKVGGHLLFVSPNGFALSQEGVINAGALTVAVPSQAVFEKFRDAGLSDASFTVEKLQKGTFVMNPGKKISIEGKIQANNKITLAAAQIEIGKGAVLDNARELSAADISDLVNIKDAAGVITAESGISAFDVKEATDGSGDILLAAKGEIQTDSLKGQAKAYVRVDGKVSSRENVSAQASAFNGRDPTDGSGAAAQIRKGAANVAAVEASVEVSGVMEAAKKLTLEAKAENVLKDTAVSSAPDIASALASGVTPVSQSAAYANLETRAEIRIREGAELKTRKDNLSLQAQAQTEVEMGAELGSAEYLHLAALQGADGKVPAAAVMYGKVDTKAQVTVDGALSSGKDLEIAATDKLKAKMAAVADTEGENNVHAAVLVAQLKGNADVTVSESADLKLSQGAEKAGALKISSSHTGTVQTGAQAHASEKSYGQLAVNYTEHDSAATVNLRKGLSVGGVQGGIEASSILISADNETASERVSALTGSFDKPGELNQFITNVSEDFISTLFGAGGLFEKSEFSSEVFKASGAAAVIKGSQNASLQVASGAELRSSGDITLSSKSFKRDHRYTAQAAGKVAGEQQNQTATGLAVLVQGAGDAQDNVASSLVVSEGAAVVAGGSVDLSSYAGIEDNRITVLKEEFLTSYEALKALFTAKGWEVKWDAVDAKAALVKESLSASDMILAIAGVVKAFENTATSLPVSAKALYGKALALINPSNYLNVYVSASAKAGKDATGIGGAFGYLFQGTRSELLIGKNALVESSGQNPAGIRISSTDKNEQTAYAGQLASFHNIPVPQSSDSSAIGAGVLIRSLDSTNTLSVAGGAQIKSLGQTQIRAADSIYGVTASVSAGKSGGKTSVEGTMALVAAEGANRLSIDDEARIQGSGVEIRAERKDNIETVAGGVAIGTNSSSSTSVGAGVAITTGSLNNELSVKRQDENSGAGQGLIDAGESGSLVIESLQKTVINTVGISAAVSSRDTSGEKGFFDKVSETLDKATAPIEKFGKKIGDKLTSLKQKVSDTAAGGMHSIAQKIHDKATGAQIQNSSASGNLNNQNSGSVPSDGTSGAGSPAQMASGSGTPQTTAADSVPEGDRAELGNSLQIGLAASVGWTAVNLGNTLLIESEDLELSGSHIGAQASSDKWVGSWAGAAGITLLSGDKSKADTSASVGGALAVNSGSHATTAQIKGITEGGGTGITLRAPVSSVDWYALENGKIIAEGLAGAMVKNDGGSRRLALDAGVSVNTLKNKVSAHAEGVRQAAANTPLAWNQTAWSGELQVTGGTGLGVSLGSSGTSTSVGLIVAYAAIENDISSSLEKVDFAKVSSLKSASVSSQKQITTALSAGVAKGENGVAISGTAAVSDLKNTVSSRTSDVSIGELAQGGDISISAGDTNNEGAELLEERLRSAAGELTEAKGYESAAAEDLSNDAYWSGIKLQTGKDSGKDQQAASEFAAQSASRQVTVSVSAAGSNGASAGAAVLVSNIDNSFSAQSEKLRVGSAGANTRFYQSAGTDALTVSVASGIAASGGEAKFSAAGSVLLSKAVQSAHSDIQNSSIRASQFESSAHNRAKNISVAGTASVSTGGTVAAGAAVTVTKAENKAVSTLCNSELYSAQILQSAKNAAASWGVAAGGSVAKNGFAGSVAVNKVGSASVVNASDLRVGGDGVLPASVQNLTFKAEDEEQIWTLAGAVALGTQGAGAGGAVAYTMTESLTEDDSKGTSAKVSKLTLQGTESAKPSYASNIEISADASDKTRTLVLAAGVGTDAPGFAGAAGVNEIKRSTLAELSELSALSRDIGTLAVHSAGKASVGNLGIVGAYGEGAGIGAGIAVNRITTDTAARMSSSGSSEALLKAQSLSVKSQSASDIEAVGVGGAVSQGAAVMGSTAVNRIENNTTSELDNTHIAASKGALLESQSDDVIGSYVGQFAGSSATAVGLSVSFNERSGFTRTLVSSSTLEQTEAGGSSGLKSAGFVDSEAVHKDVAEDISTVASLQTKRQSQSVGGLLIAAGSTGTFKTFAINAALSGENAVAGTATVNLEEETVYALVRDSSLKARGDIDVKSGSWTNISTVSTTAAAGGSAGGAAGVNVATTSRRTSTYVWGAGRRIESDGMVRITAEGKEGVSLLALSAAGAGDAAGAGLVNVTRELSLVSSQVEGISGKLTIKGAGYEQKADYLGRFNALELGLAGAGSAALAANVGVNYSRSRAWASLINAEVSSAGSGTQILASRRTENSGAIGSASVGVGALAATVLVNTMEGEASAAVEDSTVTSESDASVRSVSEDAVRQTDASFAFGKASIQGMVMVNRYNASAQTAVTGSVISAAGRAQLKAEQNRETDVLSFFGGAGYGAVGVNVVSTIIGADKDLFANDKTGLAGQTSDSMSAADKAAGSSSVSSPGILSNGVSAGAGLSNSEKAGMLRAAYQSAQAGSVAGATQLSVSDSEIRAGTIEAVAEEDASAAAGNSVTAGGATLGIGSVSASFANLKIGRNLSTEISRSALTAQNGGRIGSFIAGSSTQKTYQGSGAAVGFLGAFSNLEASGSARAVLTDTNLTSSGESALQAAVRDDSKMAGSTVGIQVSAAGAGLTNVDVSEAVNLSFLSSQGTSSGKVSYSAVRNSELFADVLSGTGGGISGAVSYASAASEGDTTVSIAGLSSAGSSLLIEALSKPALTAHARQGYASALNLSILRADTAALGKVSTSVTDSQLASGNVFIQASSGRGSLRAGEDVTAGEAVHLSSKVESYGAAIAAGGAANTAAAENRTRSDLLVRGNDFGSETALVLDSSAYAVYDLNSDLGAGGAIAAGVSSVQITHAADTAAFVEAGAQNGAADELKSFTLNVHNAEKGALKARSAGGGVITVETKAAEVSVTDTASSEGTIRGNWKTKGAFIASAASDRELKFSVENVKGAVAGYANIGLKNSITGTSRLTVGGSVVSGGAMEHLVRNDLELSSTGAYAVDNAVYGAIGGASARIDNHVVLNALLSEEGHLASGADMLLSAYTKEETNLAVRGRVAGVASGVSADNVNSIRHVNAVTLKEGALIDTRLNSSAVTLSALSDTKRDLEAISDVQGAFVGFSKAGSDNTFSQENAVLLERQSAIHSGRDVTLSVGRSLQGAESENKVKTYTHAYAHSLGDADSKASNRLALKNTLEVAGSVLAARNIDAYAKAGDWRSEELARYWTVLSGDSAGSIAIATTGGGSLNSTFKSEDAIIVSGELTAGTRTYSDLTISGLVHSADSQEQTSLWSKDGSYELQTSEAPTLNYAPGSFEGEFSFSVDGERNFYLDRYLQLQKLIAEYAAGGDTTALLAYRQEAAVLEAQMKAKGFALFDSEGNITAVLEGQKRGAVIIKNIKVSGGNIAFSTGTVRGDGVVSANAAKGIKIKNTSNLWLEIEDIAVSEQGGSVTLNGGAVSSIAGLRTLNSQANAPAATIEVVTDPQIPSFLIKHTSAGQTATEAVEADASLILKKEIVNKAGDIRIQSAGSLYLTDADLKASGRLDISSKDSVVQMYKPGNFVVGTDVSEQWAATINDFKASQSSQYAVQGARSGSGTLVSGGDIFIAAQNVVLNGVVQSGFSERSLVLGSAEQARIEEIIRRWNLKGSPKNINVYSSEYALTAEEAVSDSTGAYRLKMASWYDPVRGRVVVADQTTRGGNIFITGNFASTGGGRILAAAGASGFTVDTGGHSVELGNVSTSAVAGTIRITDTAYSGAIIQSGDKSYVVDALQTTWTNDGKTTARTGSWLVRGTSSPIAADSINVSGADYYDPRSGQAFLWSEGYQQGVREERWTQQRFKWWKAYKSPSVDTWENKKISELWDSGLSKGSSLVRLDHSLANAFEGTLKITSQTPNAQWHYEPKVVRYDNWTHFGGTVTEYASKTSASTKIYSYLVKADQRVGVGFLTGNNTVSVTSANSIFLGGLIDASGGTAALKAGASIANTSEAGALYGVSNVSLTAGRSVGSLADLIKIKGTSGKLSLSLNAAEEIGVDATGSLQGGSTYISDLSVFKAGTPQLAGSAIVLSRGNLTLNNARASSLTLSSSEGNIVVSNFTQPASRDGQQRFDAKALNGDVTVTVKSGSLAIGEIKAKNSVDITVIEGGVSDALAREDLDNRFAEEKIAMWEKAGILNAGGASSKASEYEAAVKAQEERIASEFMRLEHFRALTEEEKGRLSEADRRSFEELETKYSSATNAQQAVALEEARADSALSKVKAGREAYGWTQEQLLYAISDAIVNPQASQAPQVEVPNITASRVQVRVARDIGQELDQQTIDFTDLDINSPAALRNYELLARADVGDVSWDSATGKVTASLKRPIGIKAENSDYFVFHANSEAGSIFAATGEKMLVEEVKGTEDVRLSAGLGIEKSRSEALISGKNLVLRGGAGTLGSSNQPLNVYMPDSGWSAFSAEKGVWLHAADSSGSGFGNLTVRSAASGAEMVLKASNIYMRDFDEDLTAGRISAGRLIFELEDENGSIGSEKTAVRVSENTLVGAPANSGAASGPLKVGALRLHAVSEKGANGGFLLTADVEAAGDISIVSDTSLQTQANLKSSGSLSLKAQKDVSVKAGALEGSTITVSSDKGAVEAIGRTMESAGALMLSAATNLNLKDSSLEASEADFSAGLRLNASGLKLISGGKVSARSQGNADFSKAEISSPAEIQILTQGNIDLSRAAVKALRINCDAQQGSLFADDAALRISEALVVLADKDVRLRNFAPNEPGVGSQTNMSISSRSGSVDISGSLALSDVEGGLAIRAGRDIRADNLKVESDSAVSLLAAGSVRVLDTSIRAQNLDISANGGDLALGSAHLRALNLRLSAEEAPSGAGGSIVFKDNTGLVVGTDCIIEAGQNLTVGSGLTVSGLPGGSFARLALRGLKGDVRIADNSYLSTSGKLEIISGRDLIVGKNADIQTHGSSLGAGTYRPAGDITLRASGNMRFGENARIRTAADIDIEAGQQIFFESGAIFRAGEQAAPDGGRVLIASEELILNGASGIYAVKEIEINSGGSIEFHDNTHLGADERVKISSLRGGILFDEDVTVGASDGVKQTAVAEISGAGSIVQDRPDERASIKAEELRVRSGGEVRLGAVGGALGGGNQIGTADIEAGRSIVLGFGRSAESTLLRLNTSADGAVNGDVEVHAKESSVVLDHSVSAGGLIALYAKGMSGADLTARKEVILATEMYDQSATDGLAFGKVSGSEINVMTGEGKIRIGEISAFSGPVNVMRKGLRETSAVEIGRTSSQSEMAFYNGRGSLGTSVQVLNAQEALLNGKEGEITLVQKGGKMSSIPKGQKIVGALNTDFVLMKNAGEIDHEKMPSLVQFTLNWMARLGSTSVDTKEVLQAWAEHTPYLQPQKVEVENLVADNR